MVIGVWGDAFLQAHAVRTRFNANYRKEWAAHGHQKLNANRDSQWVHDLTCKSGLGSLTPNNPGP